MFSKLQSPRWPIDMSTAHLGPGCYETEDGIAVRATKDVHEGGTAAFAAKVGSSSESVSTSVDDSQEVAETNPRTPNNLCSRKTPQTPSKQESACSTGADSKKRSDLDHEKRENQQLRLPSQSKKLVFRATLNDSPRATLNFDAESPAVRTKSNSTTRTPDSVLYKKTRKQYKSLTTPVSGANRFGYKGLSTPLSGSKNIIKTRDATTDTAPSATKTNSKMQGQRFYSTRDHYSKLDRDRWDYSERRKKKTVRIEEEEEELSNDSGSESSEAEQDYEDKKKASRRYNSRHDKKHLQHRTPKKNKRSTGNSSRPSGKSFVCGSFFGIFWGLFMGIALMNSPTIQEEFQRVVNDFPQFYQENIIDFMPPILHKKVVEPWLLGSTDVQNESETAIPDSPAQVAAEQKTVNTAADANVPEETTSSTNKAADHEKPQVAEVKVEEKEPKVEPETQKTSEQQSAGKGKKRTFLSLFTSFFRMFR